MSLDRERKPGSSSLGSTAETFTDVPGKSTLTSTLQRKGDAAASNDAETVMPHAEAGVSGSGGEIPHRAEMERGFGVDFGDVRAHTGPQAQASSQAIGAEAYTLGNSVAFAAEPSRDLVAHEMAHVVQQRAGAGPSGGVGSAGDSFEQEADHAAATVASGGTSDLASQYGGSSLGGSLQKKAVQKYESGEHAIMGAGPTYPAGNGDLTLDNGAQVFTGELVAFGDFYADMNQLKTAPREEVESLAGLCRLEAVWYRARLEAAKGNPVTQQVAQNAPGGTPISGGNGTPAAANLRGSLPKEVPAAIWDTVFQGGKLKDLRQAIFSQFTPIWQMFGIVLAIDALPETGMAMVKSTLGRRRFRGENNSLPRPGDKNKPNDSQDPGHMGGDYLDLAQNNLSHFTADNWANWKEMHATACTDYAKAKTEQDKKMALATDMMGSHFLTDRFSAGHFVDKAELMHYATAMMVEKSGKKKKTADKTLNATLTAAVEQCFKDPTVTEQWNKGVEDAVKEGVLNAREGALLTNSLLVSKVVPGQLVGVIMDMPWRHYDGAAGPAVGGDARNYGPGQSENKKTADPGKKEDGAGDYHLGVGNLAALQVHDAINAIGFTVKNAGAQWRIQGDDHINAETIAQSDQAVAASQAQVKAGNAQPDNIKQFMPSTAWMDPKWIDDFFLGEWKGVQFDTNKLRNLKATAASATIKLQVDEKDPKSPEMASICHQIMEVLFLQPTGATATEDDGGSGLNVSMLKEFLRRRLKDMVPMAYLAVSAADLPPGTLELYAPKTADGGILPRSANDFVWQGDKLVFNLNVTGCDPKNYNLKANVLLRSAGYDTNEQGQQYGRGNPDASGGTINGYGGAINGVLNEGLISTDVPAGSVPFSVSVPEHADPNQKLVVPVQITIPHFSGSLNDQKYVAVTGDEGGTCVIGRSTVTSDNAVAGNQTPLTTSPKATGADRTTGQKVLKATAVHDNAMNWVSNTCIFAVDVGENADVDTDVTVWVKEMDWDIIGSDADIGSPKAVTAKIMAGTSTSRIIAYTPTEDDWNDTYIKVFNDPSCADTKGILIGQSRTQGHDKGGPVKNQLGRKPAATATGLHWNGHVFTFQVTPADADPVYVRFYDKDWGYDYDTSGHLLSGARNEDDPIGGIHQVEIQNGLGQVPGPDDSDAYGIVYKDAGCTAPLARGMTKG